jgi:hypothetical protein
MVADSATMRPLADVNIQIKNKHYGTISNRRGYFLIEANDEDSIMFSSVGFHAVTFRAKELKGIVVVYLRQEHRMLEPIEINSALPVPWMPKIPPFNPLQNTTVVMDPSKEAPGFRGIQTFGPGYILRGPISRFSKYEKDRKKLRRIQQANLKAKGYVEIVNSPEVKEKIMKDYNLTEEAYFEHLAIFNEKNKDIIYELEEEELNSLLILFYEENANKK